MLLIFKINTFTIQNSYLLPKNITIHEVAIWLKMSYLLPEIRFTMNNKAIAPTAAVSM
jgi:hypothetical protein